MNMISEEVLALEPDIIADAHHCEIMAMETDKDHVHILLGYGTTDSVCNIVKTLK